MLSIIAATGEPALQLVVVDFDSVDLDVEKFLINSGLPYVCVARVTRRQ